MHRFMAIFSSFILGDTMPYNTVLIRVVLSTLMQVWTVVVEVVVVYNIHNIEEL
jgi:hypothetical protein